MALDWNEYQKQVALQELEREAQGEDTGDLCEHGKLFCDLCDLPGILEARREQAAFDAAYPLESLERELSSEEYGKAVDEALERRGIKEEGE